LVLIGISTNQQKNLFFLPAKNIDDHNGLWKLSGISGNILLIMEINGNINGNI